MLNFVSYLGQNPKVNQGLFVSDTVLLEPAGMINHIVTNANKYTIFITHEKVT